MKKAIVLGAAMLLAGAAVFAADASAKPAVKFSGSATAGYSFNFGSDNHVYSSWKDYDGDKYEGTLNLSVSDADGLWTAEFDQGVIDMGDADIETAITVSLTKALGKAGIDTGDFGLSFTLGDQDWVTQLTAYGDKSGAHYQRNQAGNGGYNIVLDANYASLLKLKLIASPLDDEVNDTKKQSFGVSALVAPVDGVKVAADYSYNGRTRAYAYAYGDRSTKVNPAGDEKATFKNLFGVSAAVDVAKLIGAENYKLGVDLADRFSFGDEDDATFGDNMYNRFSATVYGGIDVVDGYAEYSLVSNDDDTKAYDNMHQLKVGANLNLVKDLGLGLYTEFLDLSDEVDNCDAITVGGDVSFSFGNVLYAVNLEYTHDGARDTDDNVFAITPSLTVSF